MKGMLLEDIFYQITKYSGKCAGSAFYRIYSIRKHFGIQVFYKERKWKSYWRQ